MSALMRTRHTEKSMEFFISVPLEDAQKLDDAIKKELALLGHTVRMVNGEGEELYTFEEVFPDTHPGMILHGFRIRDCLTQTALADKLNIKRTRISEMENGKRPISNAMARKLGKIFDIPYKAFL